MSLESTIGTKALVMLDDIARFSVKSSRRKKMEKCNCLEHSKCAWIKSVQNDLESTCQALYHKYEVGKTAENTNDITKVKAYMHQRRTLERYFYEESYRQRGIQIGRDR